MSDHAREVASALGLRAPTNSDLPDVIEAAAQAASTTDRGLPIVAGIIAALRSAKIILPAPMVIERAAIAGRARARNLSSRTPWKARPRRLKMAIQDGRRAVARYVPVAPVSRCLPAATGGAALRIASPRRSPAEFCPGKIRENGMMRKLPRTGSWRPGH